MPLLPLQTDTLKSIKKQLDKEVKKSIKQMRAQMEDYEIYRDNYEYMRCSPMMQSLLRDNRELKREIKELKRLLQHKTIVKTESSRVIDLTNDDNEIEIKTIHLTSEPNIVYDLTECIGSDDISDVVEEDDEELSVGQELGEHEVEDQYAVVTEEADASADEDDAGEEEVDEEEAGEEEADASAGEEEAEEEGVYEVKIKNKSYYVTNETNGTIYTVDADGEVGDEVGKYVDGKPTFNKK